MKSSGDLEDLNMAVWNQLSGDDGVVETAFEIGFRKIWRWKAPGAHPTKGCSPALWSS